MNKTVTPVTRQSKKSLEMTLTHQDKLYFLKERLTKGEQLTYHEQIAPVLLPHLKDRPSSLRRFPQAILRKSFFPEEPSVDDSRVVSSLTLNSEESKRDIRDALVQNLDVLLYVVNLGFIDHNPWMSRVLDHLKMDVFMKTSGGDCKDGDANEAEPIYNHPFAFCAHPGQSVL